MKEYMQLLLKMDLSQDGREKLKINVFQSSAKYSRKWLEANHRCNKCLHFMQNKFIVFEDLEANN